MAAVVDTIIGQAPHLMDYIGGAAIMVGFVGINISPEACCSSGAPQNEETENVPVKQGILTPSLSVTHHSLCYKQGPSTVYQSLIKMAVSGFMKSTVVAVLLCLFISSSFSDTGVDVPLMNGCTEVCLPSCNDSCIRSGSAAIRNRLQSNFYSCDGSCFSAELEQRRFLCRSGGPIGFQLSEQAGGIDLLERNPFAKADIDHGSGEGEGISGGFIFVVTDGSRGLVGGGGGGVWWCSERGLERGFLGQKALSRNHHSTIAITLHSTPQPIISSLSTGPSRVQHPSPLAPVPSGTKLEQIHLTSSNTPCTEPRPCPSRRTSPSPSSPAQSPPHVTQHPHQASLFRTASCKPCPLCREDPPVPSLTIISLILFTLSVTPSALTHSNPSLVSNRFEPDPKQRILVDKGAFWSCGKLRQECNGHSSTSPEE
ncbi:hypothetical protein MRB53_013873 [Persea americana]|uniref:Uncharacterized protein n=1 Tax=Persea americana TaxID=3435 RepID=A0ACC2K9Q3_PERAE|nr:hypothetical protein MRB53_013873 [Persea americana]